MASSHMTHWNLAQSSTQFGTGVPLRELALILLIAAAVTYLVTGSVRKILVSRGRFIMPRERDVHTVPIPRLGGVGMFTGFMVAVYVASQLPALSRGFPPTTSDMNAVIIAACIIMIVGIADDLYDIPALLKMAGQVLAALVMSLLGLSWYLLYLPFGSDGGTTLVLSSAQSTLVTVVLTVTIINAVNFVDGLDGLAAGLGLISALAILLFSLTILHDQGGAVSAYPPAIISALLAGICLGFLPHNFEPARIFMGDSGSMLIGLLLAAACTSASGRIDFSFYGVADMFALISPVLIVLAVLFVPLLDLLMAITRRVKAGKSPFSADKKHLHHRLLSLGHTHRRVVLILYTWVIVVAFAAVGSTFIPFNVLAILVGVLMLAAVGITSLPVWRDHRKELRDAAIGFTP